MTFRKETPKKQSSFNKITISLASPELILEQSSGVDGITHGGGADRWQ